MKRILVFASAAIVLFAVVTLIRKPSVKGSDRDRQGGDHEDERNLEVQIGSNISPVKLNLKDKDPDLVGLGSYIVNAQAGCSDCHTCPSYKPGHNPFGSPFGVSAQAQPVPQAPASNAVPVSVDNFNRAETDMYFGAIVKNGGIGHLNHRRELYLTDSPIVRPNRDTLYSGAVFDLDAGPVTITLPDAGKRFISMQVIDEDQYTRTVYYGAGRYMMSREEMGTRYGSLVIRILVNPEDPERHMEIPGSATRELTSVADTAPAFFQGATKRMSGVNRLSPRIICFEADFLVLSRSVRFQANVRQNGT